MHFVNELLLGAIPLPRAFHDRRAMGVVGTDVNAAISAELLKSNPDIGLDVFDQVTNVNRPVGVRECGSD